VKPLREDRAVILPAEDAAFVRQALAASSGILGLAGAAGGAVRAALETVADGRPLDQVHRDVNLAVGLIDHAAPARRNP
jgi:hypothetical protein